MFVDLLSKAKAVCTHRLSISDAPLVGISSRGGACFTVENRIRRALWNIIWIPFGYYSFRPFHAWRRLLLRIFGARIEGPSRIYPGVKIWAPWNLEIRGRACIGEGATLYNQAKIVIDHGAVISQGVHLCTGTHNYNSIHFELIAKPIHIKSHAWLAAEVFIHPGVTIGEGAVIGARSVVSDDMPDWTVCSGFPCQAIKPRNKVLSINDVE